MPSSRHTAFTAGALLALALFLALAGGLRAQCPPPGGYRSTDAGTDRFSGIKTTRTHLPPVYGPAVPNLFAFTGDHETVFALIFTGLAEGIRYTRCSTVAILADGKPVKAQGDASPGAPRSSRPASRSKTASKRRRSPTARPTRYTSCPTPSSPRPSRRSWMPMRSPSSVQPGRSSSGSATTRRAPRPSSCRRRASSLAGSANIRHRHHPAPVRPPRSPLATSARHLSSSG